MDEIQRFTVNVAARSGSTVQAFLQYKAVYFSVLQRNVLVFVLMLPVLAFQSEGLVTKSGKPSTSFSGKHSKPPI